MSSNSKKLKIEQEYDDYNSEIENRAQEEIKKIKEKIAQLKMEAEKIGDALESEHAKAQSGK